MTRSQFHARALAGRAEALGAGLKDDGTFNPAPSHPAVALALCMAELGMLEGDSK